MIGPQGRRGGYEGHVARGGLAGTTRCSAYPPSPSKRFARHCNERSSSSTNGWGLVLPKGRATLAAVSDAATIQPMSAADYLAWERSQPTKHEYHECPTANGHESVLTT